MQNFNSKISSFEYSKMKLKKLNFLNKFDRLHKRRAFILKSIYHDYLTFYFWTVRVL